MLASVAPIEHTLTLQAPRGWWLEVAWRFQNPAERPLFVLTKGPLSIIDGQPLVINHAATGHPLVVDPNVDPDMEFDVAEAHGSLDLRRMYPLPPIDLRAPRAVVGRFAVSYERPDPEWRQGHMWEAVEQWQQILESARWQISAAVPE